MALTTIAPAESRTYPTWNGAAPTIISVSLASGTDPGAFTVTSPSIYPLPLERAVTDAEPTLMIDQLWGQSYTLTNTGTVDLVADTTFPPGA